MDKISNRSPRRVATPKGEETTLPLGTFDLLNHKASAEVNDEIVSQRKQHPLTQKNVDALQEIFPALAEIPDGELMALNDYLTVFYPEMNNALRKGTNVDAWDEEIVGAASALARLPGHEGRVYRGTMLRPASLERYQPGSIVAEKGFTSTSTDPEVVRTFNSAVDGERVPVTFVIENHGAGKDIAWFAPERDAEDEVLFPPGTRFKVLGREDDPKTGETTIQLEQV
jgi:hypothetical protein